MIFLSKRYWKGKTPMTISKNELASIISDAPTKSVAWLTDAYNGLATMEGMKTLKKFETKTKGIQRVSELASSMMLRMEAAEKPAKKSKPAGEKKVSVSGFCREQILAGKTNDEIWAMLKDQFGLDESKKYYPSWNRADMIRKGLITK